MANNLIFKNKLGQDVVLNGATGLRATTTDGTKIDYIAPEGKKAITDTNTVDVTSYAQAQVVDANLVAGNIREGVSVLGVTGTVHEGITPSGTKQITSTTATDVTSYAQAQVVDANLVAENIKKDVTILGVTGTHEGGGGGSVSGAGVKFVDYDGTLIEFWDASSVASKTALPNNPTGHTRLVAEGWNYTLANIKLYMASYPNAILTVGQMYHTVSGMTEFDITVTKATGLTVTCRVPGEKNWGDGTTDSTTSHAYANYGDYTIKCSGTSLAGNIFSYTTSYLCTAAYIGSGVTSIDYQAFCYCYSLASISIPDSVTSIDRQSFRACLSLKFVSFPDRVTSIGSNTFYLCSSLTSISIPEGVASISANTFCYCYSLASISIPDSVTSIGSSAFADCRALTSILIPDSVASIDSNVFFNCYSLTSISIPEGVAIIDSETFRNCYSLTDISIPNSVTSIGYYAFGDCRALTSILIPDSVASIDSNAFFNCYSLTSISIPEGVASISINAFCYCYALASISIPDSVTSIGSSAFADCDSLTSISIPEGVTSIKDGAFFGCDTILKYDFSSATSVPTLSNTNTFNGINAICKIIVPDSLYDDWIAADIWSTYANYIYKASEVS